MNVHQVITGALNRGENVFAVGSVEGINFTACAVGCDIVILASDFQRVQIIPGAANNRGVQVTCLDCCSDSGKIAAAFHDQIKIFEPTALVSQKSNHKLHYRWFETSRISAGGPVSRVSWNLEGLRLLISCGPRLQLYQHRLLNRYYSGSIEEPQDRVQFAIDIDPNETNEKDDIWQQVWNTELASPVRFVKFSPDGTLFATAGSSDRLVKIWYQDLPDKECGPDLKFSYFYLYHPRAVLGFEWRKSGRYMPKSCGPNVLVTWCKDHISRIWCETWAPEGSEIAELGADVELTSAGRMSSSKQRLHHKHFRLRHVRHKITHRLKHLKTLKQKQEKTGRLNSTLNEDAELFLRDPSSPSMANLSDHQLTHHPSTLHFHLAVSINAETDCFLVPSLESSSVNSTFAVHWLNNKELVFSLGAEKLLAESLSSAQLQSSPEPDEAAIKVSSGRPSGPSVSTESSQDSWPTGEPHSVPTGSDYLQDAHTPSSATGSSFVGDMFNKDILDYKLDALLRQWHDSPDMLFTIHPIDGSLLIWTLEWLDDWSRQPTVSFSSRFPAAFPVTDAASLHQNLVTFNPHDPVYVEVLQRNYHESDVINRSIKNQPTNTIFVLTNHENGSLNLWHLTVDEKSNFSAILNIAHKQRMCGHRFRINKVVCHPVLPLLLTTSRHSNSVNKRTSEDTGEAYNSEMILWKVSPVGPLCRSGGLRELSRINSVDPTAFVDLAWVPAILPSSTLGSVCNSPSSCFVASDGRCLHVYQAVIDARALLAEINVAKLTRAVSAMSDSSSGMDDPRLHNRRDVVDGFDVVSSQSTARPGCILQLASICNGKLNYNRIQFLHVYHEQTVWGDQMPLREMKTNVTRERNSSINFIDRSDSVIDHSKSDTFHERFYVVLIEKEETGPRSFVHMWSLDIASQPPSPIKPVTSLVNGHLSSPETDDPGFFPTAPKPMPSAAQLYIHSIHKCTQVLQLPSGASVIGAYPAAGHLPSSNLYPACRTPYLLVTACSDDVLRFWKCQPQEDGRYVWMEWRMIADNQDSSLEVEGPIVAVNSAYSSRLACAYEPVGHAVTEDPFGQKLVNVQITVFECESTGGIDWVQEDTVHLKNIKIPKSTQLQYDDFAFDAIHSPVDNMIMDWQTQKPTGSKLSRIPSVPKGIGSNMRQVVADHLTHDSGQSSTVYRNIVQIDWVSAEDGSHILTVGVGPKIILYAQVSEDIAQRNITLMKESEVQKRPILRKASSLAGVQHQRRKLVRWVSLRTIELHSVDGLPPLPIKISWVRDGVLVVGMESEMRIYNQWNIIDESNKKIQSARMVETTDEKPQPPESKPLARLGIPNTVSLHISPSHSMLDLAKKGRADGIVPKKPIKKDNITKASSGVRQDSANGAIDGVKGETVVEIASDEGVFEAARLATPMLPQYHPKQLMEMMNAGKTRRVKAILLHVIGCLRQRNVVTSHTLGRQGSFRKGKEEEPMQARKMSVSGLAVEEVALDYDEIESVPPLPLYALLAADSDLSAHAETDSGVSMGDASGQNYEVLFNGPTGPIADLDSMLEDDEEADDVGKMRTRLTSTSSTGGHGQPATTFTAKHNRLLTRYLTHLHLPGLSSVDQMHLLAVADTLSHFSSDVMDKLSQVNAQTRHTALGGVIDSSVGGGYATMSTSGTDNIDECGLRYLMAMKQHEYLLLCLPMKQRKQRKAIGLAPSNIIWALHSENETELLNSISCLQRGQPAWDELKALGVGWWLRNPATLRLCIEKIAKNAYQQRSDPMDASLYYLAMKKKNVLTHLFKSARDSKMSDFFSRNFEEEKWRKAALKNAFVLMGKQRFQHAAAFFLLGGSLSDAVQTCLVNLNDLQLAMVIVRLYESDPENQNNLMRQLLCRNVLGVEPEDLASQANEIEPEELPPRADLDPFIRSMAFWHLKEYSKAATTFLDEVRLGTELELQNTVVSDIYNFYSYLRNQPLVVRQRLADEGVQIGTTEKFLAVAKQMENRITPAERRLCFRTAAAHLKGGCALLALDVLCRLPKDLHLVVPGSSTLSSLVPESRKTSVAQHGTDWSSSQAADFDWSVGGGGGVNLNDATDWSTSGTKSGEFDWSTPLGTQPVKHLMKDEPLELKWSDDEDLDSDEETGLVMKKPPTSPMSEPVKEVIKQMSDDDTSKGPRRPDTMAQQMKFVACLKILMEELATLASGFDVEGGHLRYQLFHWLEKEVEVLKHLCDYNLTSSPFEQDHTADHDLEWAAEEGALLHEAIRSDRADLAAKLKRALLRRQWLAANQQLLRTLTSYCALHGSQGVGLASARMELLLLLLELQQDPAVGSRQLSAPMPVHSSFPLLAASVASFKTVVSGPMRYLKNQASDILLAVTDIREPPSMGKNLARVYLFYSLSQCLSACIYESLSDLENIPKGFSSGTGYLLRRSTRISESDDLQVTTFPSKWPGVQNLVALLSREKDDDTPNLQVLLAECFLAVYMALFAYAFTAYDSRWLYRLSAHHITPKMFATVFGGGGEKKLSSSKAQPPRPKPPSKPRDQSPLSIDRLTTAVDPASLRAKFNAKLFGQAAPGSDGLGVQPRPQQTQHLSPSHQTVLRWVPPKKNIVAYFTAKAPVNAHDELGLEYDSDDSLSDAESEPDVETVNADFEKEHILPKGYGWTMLRLALVRHVIYKINQFLSLCGIDLNDLASLAPKVHASLQTLETWARCLTSELDEYPGGCPTGFLPHSSVNGTANGPSLHKYRTILEPSNTPFETEDPTALPVKRLWLFLVRQEHLMEIFIRYIFRSKQTTQEASAAADRVSLGALPEPVKIVQREQDPIVAFAVNTVNPGWLAVSTGREIQEMDISCLLEQSVSWLHDTTELDIALAELKKEPLRDNDDYQLIDGGDRRDSNVGSFMTPFIVDRSRKALRKLCKRQMNGIRRMESHPSLPYYVSGAADGSVRLWEWGVAQPLYTPRMAGQYAKVTRARFSANGNKFAVTDGDGCVSLWQMSHGATIRKPFFNLKAHSKSCEDFRFVGDSSSLLVTAGYGSGEMNLALWDTLLPQHKAQVQSWSCHPEGASCVLYVPQQQTLISGGRNGEMCFWDLRQRQLRSSIKAFDHSTVKTLCLDPALEFFVAGSSDGDIKIWSLGSTNQIVYALNGEHASRGGFSLRQVGASQVQGVQQLHVDSNRRLFSSGADCSFKMRTLPSILNAL